MSVQSYQDLVVWQKAMALVEEVYRLSSGLPQQEIYGLTSQLRRSAVSIPSNIAEGRARRTTRDFLNFLSIASGSLAETETQVFVAERLNYVKEPQAEEVVQLCGEVGRLLHGLSNSLRDKLRGNDT